MNGRVAALLGKDKGQVALAASLAVRVVGHKDGGAAVLSRAFSTSTNDSIVLVNLVVL